MPDEIRGRLAETAKIEDVRRRLATGIQQAGAPPLTVQLQFLSELMADKAASEAFLKDPKKYVLDHRVLITPEAVRLIAQYVVDPSPIAPDEMKRLGREGADILSSIQARAWPAAAAAAAAVVTAAAAVVTAVVTAVRTKVVEHLDLLRNAPRLGYAMPSGKVMPAAKQPR